ncbi:hypothetical protein M1N06_04855 [Peptococcaceae bacterium]|nr:hypothetical protein [Peptococcaceae bacterium]
MIELFVMMINFLMEVIELILGIIIIIIGANLGLRKGISIVGLPSNCELEERDSWWKRLLFGPKVSLKDNLLKKKDLLRNKKEERKEAIFYKEERKEAIFYIVTCIVTLVILGGPVITSLIISAEVTSQVWQWLDERFEITEFLLMSLPHTISGAIMANFRPSIFFCDIVVFFVSHLVAFVVAYISTIMLVILIGWVSKKIFKESKII